VGVTTAGSLPPASLVLHGPCPVRGEVRVPGDKSVSHRALLLAAQAAGRSRITGLSGGDDVARTLRAVRELGAVVEELPDGALTVEGGKLAEPATMLDHGNSGTGMRLMAGVVAGHEFFTVLTGDEFLRRRPMARIVAPLREMGASVDGRGGGTLAPLAIRGGGLRGIRYASPVASAQVKSAILLAGLNANGSTTVVEPVVTRRHTEEMLAQFGVDVVCEGTSVTVHPGPLSPVSVDVPGDPSQSAFWVVAGLVAPGSEVALGGLYLGHGRAGFLSVLAAMGAPLDVDRSAGAVRATPAPLRGTAIDPADIASFIDEVPVLAVAAAAAEGTTTLRGAEELRVKESDRIATTVAMLRAFGVPAREEPDGLVVSGGAAMRGAEVDSHGDHRIAMSAAIAALRAQGRTVVHGWESVTTSYPGFADELNRLTDGAARAEVVASP
jgi:3-phosphoshikimate 1-carboxyvinyltransferase